MFPFGFALGAIVGGAAVLVLGPQVVQRGRPVAKAALKAALLGIHEARVRGAEIAEAAEDLYAESKGEVTTEVLAAAMAAARAKAAEQAQKSKAQEPSASARKPSTMQAAREQTASNGSPMTSSGDA